MKKVLSLALAAVLVCSVSACGNRTKQKLGLVKRAPNEFLVTSRKPLALPPQYDLRPVVEGQEVVPTVDYDKKVQGLSEADKKLLSKVDARNSPEDIKTQIDDELNALKQND